MLNRFLLWLLNTRPVRKIGEWIKETETLTGERDAALARVREARSSAIAEAAELVRTWAQDNETIQPSFTRMVAAIRDLDKQTGEG